MPALHMKNNFFQLKLITGIHENPSFCDRITDDMLLDTQRTVCLPMSVGLPPCSENILNKKPSEIWLEYDRLK